jgi:hypothetical protein
LLSLIVKVKLLISHRHAPFKPIRKGCNFSELQSLNAQSAKLGSALARARAGAEIASALWYLDQEEAKRMLTKAYELTLLEEAKMEKNAPEPSAQTWISRMKPRAREPKCAAV